MGVFSEDIVLDEAAFDAASADFAALNVRLQNLRTELEEMLNTLKTGFDTPAGAQFLSSCAAHLFEPLDAQSIVLEHISTTLAQCREAYQSVFQEYETLQSAIKQVKKG